MPPPGTGAWPWRARFAAAAPAASCTLVTAPAASISELIVPLPMFPAAIVPLMPAAFTPPAKTAYGAGVNAWRGASSVNAPPPFVRTPISSQRSAPGN